ncbi:neurensin-1-like, partial [Amphiura filiformis]|uniref:neurensin-1-like n=1 Tax=Amphiura filiformis TaxID=82378 RepID=UPI003B2206B8
YHQLSKFIGCQESSAAISTTALLPIRKKLPRPPRLESVSESEHSDKSYSPSLSSGSDFGVKSYLHKFYEDDPQFKDRADVYCEAEDHPLARLRHKRRACAKGTLWWKAGAWVGLNILILAVLALMIGYFVTPKKEILRYTDDTPVINQDAVSFNKKLDDAKLAGLILLCSGGFVLAISLLVPSFTHATDEEEEEFNTEEVRIDPDGTFPPYMPITSGDENTEEGIPVTSAVTNIQPLRAKGEFVVAGSGMVTVQGESVKKEE